MLEMIDKLYIYNTNVSAIRHLPGMFLPSDLLREHRDALFALEPIVSGCRSQLAGYSAGMFQALWLCGVFFAVFGAVV